MIRKQFKKILILILTLGFLFTNGNHIQAAENNDEITKSMNITIKAQDDYSFEVTQEINVDFKNNYKHGVSLVIPYNDEVDLDVISVKGPGSYQVDNDHNKSGYYKQIMLGDASELISGKQSWVVKYRMRGYKRKNTKDIVSLALLPTFWDMPIEHSTTKIIMPKPTKWQKLQIKCGKAGSNTLIENDKHFKISKKTPTELVVEGQNIPNNYGASMRANLDKGYWSNSQDYRNFPIKVIGVLVGWLIICFVIWLIKGRDQKSVMPVEFYPPEDLTPTEVGYLLDGNVDDQDILSIYFYLAKKGYVKIKLQKEGRPRIIKVKDLKEDEPKFVARLFNAMFEQSDEFNPSHPTSRFAIEVSQIPARMKTESKYGNINVYDRVSDIVRIIALVLTCILTFIIFGTFYRRFEMNNIGMIRIGIVILLITQFFIINLLVSRMHTNSKKENTGLKIVAILVGIIIGIFTTSVTVFPYNLPISGIIMGVILNAIIVLIVLTRRVNPKLTAIRGRLLGFRNFIELAEADKLNTLSNEDPEYFYDILPYAYVLGLADKWVAKFESFHLLEPSWLDSELSTFEYYYMMNIIDSMIDLSVMGMENVNSFNNSNSNFTGFNGVGSGFGSSSGGFSSGSGFGGGGGGSW